MIRSARACFTVVVLLAFPFAALAAAVLVATPDELTARAEIVVNAIPTKIDLTDERGYKADSAVPTRLVVARLKVIGIVKGSAPGEIELRFPVLDIKAISGALINGPLDVTLDRGRRYRFYLRTVSGQSWYVTVLDGELDDGTAVQPLDDREADGSAPLLRAEAMKRAADYVTSSLPSADIAHMLVEARYRWSEPSWSFSYFFRDPATYPAGASDAQIIVAGDGSIDPRSWIADGIYRSADEIDQAQVGRAARLTLRAPYRSDPAEPLETVSGRIDAVAADTIELEGASSETAPVDFAIPKSDIVSVVLMTK